MIYDHCNQHGHYVITGGAGFLGSQLIAALQKNGDMTQCIVVDPSPPHPYDTIQFDRAFVTYKQEKFQEDRVLDSVLPNASTVFHLCSIGHTGKYGARCYQDEVYKINVEGTKNLIYKCRKYKVARFVYSSSVAVVFVGKPLHNVTEEMPYPEDHEFLDIYSKTKAEAEKFIISQSCPEFKTTCLRFRAIYGPQDFVVAEKVVNMVGMNFFRIKILRKSDETRSNMSSGRNCGLALHLANQALMEEEKPHGKAYFIHDGEEIQQYAVWTPLIKALGKQPPTFRCPYFLVSPFITLISFFCHEILKVSPPMTRFELEVLVTTNTYSIEAAKQDLGYRPTGNHFQQVVDYYRVDTKEKIEAHRPTAYLDYDDLIFILVLIFWTISLLWSSH
ncbi:Protein CBG14582 [Caenorhabditis briggsae]|uniref:Protein CBG14582 n=3 Tax=Caenorhabditis briggsae TaxID=6238 RepID=A8XK88_CAEBR|nr:Protein CBG14582 [Caenorhabditis briggsae]ULT82286.1 hypothetical protein L3Y34_011921 [Caenorhabditis briggsae]CAP33062.2 Protein CBG14582 [Caenorhabditis briggsae]